VGGAEKIGVFDEAQSLLLDADLPSAPVHDPAIVVRSFVSSIDGSMQTYAVLPSVLPGAATLLTLHGAGVEARNQAASYARKAWLNVVAPTNRRPYGFDWEDWGRLDALEVLEDFARETRARDEKSQIGDVYLTGHSMGGHGTWQLGVTFPDRWVAIGPSAGWRSFATYASKTPTSGDPVARMLSRAASPSDTESLATNLAGVPVYALHGDADDNVPVTEMRAMLERLKPFHHDLQWHEQKGAGHWWDVKETPGVDCVDWAPMLETFARRRRPPPTAVTAVDFATMSPGVSAKRDWVEVLRQEHGLEPSRVRLRYDAATGLITGTTENVVALSMHPPTPEPADKPPFLTLELDGARLETRSLYSVVVERVGGAWVQRLGPDPEIDPKRKYPARYGPFKDAFRNRMALFYGTKGTTEANAWAYAKARYDAETWYVRGNGSVDVLPDTAWNPKEHVSRNAILYGDADTNALWDRLLVESPVRVATGSARVGSKEAKGNDLACLFVRPSPLDDRALVAVIAGTGPVGRRLTERIPIFVSGVGIPDVMVMRADALSKGEQGLACAGFFGPDWGVETGDFAWREEGKEPGKPSEAAPAMEPAAGK
jgi:pimeloyl-ACP methyl ester carboxylesterase